MAGRAAHFLRDNSHTLKEPVNKITTKAVVAKDEGRWWEWNVGADDKDPKWKNKKRSSSAARAEGGQASNGNGFIDSSGFQTTYQKEHGYLKNFQVLVNDISLSISALLILNRFKLLTGNRKIKKKIHLRTRIK